jgi:protein-tyrosine phosphatase
MVVVVTVIDLHSHVLPGIDDGPDDLDGSLAIARQALRSGTRTLLATPHASSRYPNDAATISAALERLHAALEREGVELEVPRGAEIALTHISEMEGDELAALTLGGSGWLLVEPPFSPVAVGLESTIQALLKDGYGVLLAHPERCPAFQRDPATVERLVAGGVLTSITAGALEGRFGSTARRYAVHLLEAGQAHNVASDAHDHVSRPPSLGPQIQKAGFGALAEWLTEEVPAAILTGTAIPSRPGAARRPRGRLLARLGL